MRKLTSVLCKVLFTATIICAPASLWANGHNVLRDADFEARLPAKEGGWTLFDESQFSEAQARSGSGSVFNWGFSRTVPTPPYLFGTASGSFQEFAADPGSRWRLTGYGLAPVAIRGASAFGIVQVSFFDAEGNDLGTVETADTKGARAKTSNQINASSAAEQWTFLDTGVVTAPEGATKIHAFTLFVDYSGSEISQGVYFDDLELCALAADGSGCN